MIKTFRHKGVERFFKRGTKAGIIAAHADRLSLQLAVLNRAKRPEEMNIPGWNFHALSGRNPRKQDLAGHFAVSVSGNWRLTFTFEDGDAVLVDYQDYH
ncbi:type II toxin-antitoxin system RelE/ParE family toxin [Cupriavidus sp. Marseille-Q8015]